MYKSIKKTHEKIFDLDRKYFLATTTKAQFLKEYTNNMNIINIKNF